MKKRKTSAEYGRPIAARCGGFPTGRMSQEEVGRILGISTARVSQLERSGLKKLTAQLTKGI